MATTAAPRARSDGTAVSKGAGCKAMTRAPPAASQSEKTAAASSTSDGHQTSRRTSSRGVVRQPSSVTSKKRPGEQTDGGAQRGFQAIGVGNR